MLPIEWVILPILLFVAWGIIATLQSTATRGEKTFWIVLMVIMPLIGFAIWFLCGPGPKSLPGTEQRL